MEDQIRTWLGSGSINIFGLPFAGKDTQGQSLADLFGAPLLSSGQILRSEDVPTEVKIAIDGGKMAPTEQFHAIVLPFLSKAEFANRPLMLSSVGRMHDEEHGVIAAAAESGHPIKAVIFLTINESILRERWAISQERGDRGERADDAEHILDTRLDEFRNRTLPVIEEYRKLGLLIEIDGSGTPEAVYADILNALHERATNS